MTAWSPKSNAALIAERALHNRVRDLLVQTEGIYSPNIIRIEQDPDRTCVLFTVESLKGPKAMTAFIYLDGEIEIVRDTFAF